MTNEEQRFFEVEQIWLDVDENYYQDMAKTKNEEQARRVETTWYNARTAYMRALADGLAKNSTQANDVLKELKAANKEVLKARKDSEKFTTTLEKIEKAIGVAMSLVLLTM